MSRFNSWRKGRSVTPKDPRHPNPKGTHRHDVRRRRGPRPEPLRYSRPSWAHAFKPGPAPDDLVDPGPTEGWPTMDEERQAEVADRAANTRRRNRARQGKDSR